MTCEFDQFIAGTAYPIDINFKIVQMVIIKELAGQFTITAVSHAKHRYTRNIITAGW